MNRIKLSLLSFILVLSVLPSNAALADTGPKPTMEFTFKQGLDGEQVTITSGIMYECDQPDCRDAAPLQELGPQRFTCDALSCRALAYGFSDYHKLEIQFSDGKTRQSNIFQTAGFDSKYTVTIRPYDLLVESQFGLGILPPTMLILIACVCVVLGIVLVIVLAIFLIRRSRKQ